MRAGVAHGFIRLFASAMEAFTSRPLRQFQGGKNYFGFGSKGGWKKFVRKKRKQAAGSYHA